MDYVRRYVWRHYINNGRRKYIEVCHPLMKCANYIAKEEERRHKESLRKANDR